MTDKSILEDKHILVVDDEPDILETLEELLYMSSVHTASTFEAAVLLLKENTYDLAILDIMGVRGYDLLRIAHKKDIPALMLTAHALTPDNLKQSMEQGADAYVPKDKLFDISTFVEDVLIARKEGKKAHESWFASIKPLFDKMFGKDWHQDDDEFWKEFDEKP
ncbi:MAG: response regulator [Desulfobacteraceae bacterium]|nr:response regulator [Desulfobacteraceae bacterium]